ncbi:MAG: SPOR domain-containing protein [Phycisphaerales bacterium]|nr:SPOR domain-containing protein [Phycisphaerales bacterium]
MVGHGCRWLVMLVLGLTGLVVTGCASQQVHVPGATSEAMQRYEAGAFAESFRLASLAAASERGDERDRANLIAGMSAYRLGDTIEARRRLEPLTRSSAGEIAGRASVTLGLIDADEGRHLAAISRFTAAARNLEGDDCARAHLLAAASLELSLQPEEAAAQYAEALAHAQTPSLRATIRSRMEGTPGGAPYTIQVGAFSRSENAMRSASRLRDRAASLGLGTPRVEEIRDPTGRVLHAVRVGRFGSREQAEAARGRLGEGVVRVRE